MSDIKKLSTAAIEFYADNLAVAGVDADQAIRLLNAASLKPYEKASLLRKKIKSLGVVHDTKAQAVAGIRALHAGLQFDLSDNGAFLYVTALDNHRKEQRLYVNSGKMTKKQKAANKAKVLYYLSVVDCTTGNSANEGRLAANDTTIWANFATLTVSLAVWKHRIMYEFGQDARNARAASKVGSAEVRAAGAEERQSDKKIVTGLRKLSAGIGPLAFVKAEMAAEFGKKASKTVKKSRRKKLRIGV